MSSSDKQTERELQKIIQDNVEPSNGTSQLKLLIYYRNRKFENLLIKINPNKRTDHFNVVYMY